VTPAETYFAAAYLVVFMLVLAYVLLMAVKLQRLEEAVDDLSAREAGRDEPDAVPAQIR
jgi:CcmD family protein